MRPIRSTRALRLLAAAACTAALAAGCSSMSGGSSHPMSFFITSSNPGQGGNLGGLAGADAQCQRLADAVGAGGKTWRAYLSTVAADGRPAVNARDRIGSGPWVNAKGVTVATSVADLHSANAKLGKANSLTGPSLQQFRNCHNHHHAKKDFEPFLIAQNIRCHQHNSRQQNHQRDRPDLHKRKVGA